MDLSGDNPLLRAMNAIGVGTLAIVQRTGLSERDAVVLSTVYSLRALQTTDPEAVTHYLLTESEDGPRTPPKILDLGGAYIIAGHRLDRLGAGILLGVFYKHTPPQAEAVLDAAPGMRDVLG